VINETVVTVTQPGSASFECTAVARPRPSITWYRVEEDDSRTMLNGSEEGVSIYTPYYHHTDRIEVSTLMFYEARPSLAAEYICEATNPMGSAETNATLVVYGKCRYLVTEFS